MPTVIQGPAIYLAQFAGAESPFNSLDAICAWAASCGFKGIQLPSWDGRLFDLERAAGSKTYCDEVTGTAARHGITITELGSHLQGQLVAVHPAYDEAFDGFAPAAVRGNPKARQALAIGRRELVQVPHLAAVGVAHLHARDVSAGNPCELYRALQALGWPDRLKPDRHRLMHGAIGAVGGERRNDVSDLIRQRVDQAHHHPAVRAALDLLLELQHGFFRELIFGRTRVFFFGVLVLPGAVVFQQQAPPVRGGQLEVGPCVMGQRKNDQGQQNNPKAQATALPTWFQKACSRND